MAQTESLAVAEAQHAPAGFWTWMAALVRQHRSRLLGLARRRGLDAEDALDAVQESFLSFVKLPEARAIANVPEDSAKLLNVLLRHNVLNRRRKRIRHARAQLLLEAAAAETDGATSEELISRAEELARVHGCIVQMGNLQRSVVMLSLLDEQPRSEVAQLLGISEGYVRVLLHRAREHLRTCDYDAQEP